MVSNDGCSSRTSFASDRTDEIKMECGDSGMTGEFSVAKAYALSDLSGRKPFESSLLRISEKIMFDVR